MGADRIEQPTFAASMGARGIRPSLPVIGRMEQIDRMLDVFHEAQPSEICRLRIVRANE